MNPRAETSGVSTANTTNNTDSSNESGVCDLSFLSDISFKEGDTSDIPDIEFLEDAYYKECLGEYPDFLYHIARNKYGRIYFRVVRTLLLNRVLCSNRVSQMTKTYNDIEAVTRLLEEKEKDLELTARIGQQLLDHNNKLEARSAELEAENKAIAEKYSQLSYDFQKKVELVDILMNATEDSGSENGTPTGPRHLNIELMHKKIGNLEEENKNLRCEAEQLAKDTDKCEEAEAQLMKDIGEQLANTSLTMDALTDELDRQKHENKLLTEQNHVLLKKLAEAEMNLHKFTLENEEYNTILTITKDNQTSLASELADFKEKYAEVMAILQDTQEQLRRQRKRGMPTARSGLMPSLVHANNGPHDSLQSELESSLYSELSLDSGISGTGLPAYKKIFETVRCASRSSLGSMESHSSLSNHSNHSSLGPHQLFPRAPPNHPSNNLGMMSTMSSSVMSSSSQPRMSSFQQAATTHRSNSSLYSSSFGYPSLDSKGHSDNEVHSDSDDGGYPGVPQQGVPGVPGAADLEAALRRLTPAEVIARRATLGSGPLYGGYDYDRGSSPPPYLPLECRTPDSIMSTGSSGLSGLSAHSAGWKLPEKLQIVKPMEGSQTLHQWSQLATPTLSGLLEERPGVKIRGGRGLDELGLELYTLCDLEEDDEESNPGKHFQNSGYTYTYTNSTVMHPDDGTSVTHSTAGSQMASACSSRQPTVPSTPVCHTPRRGLSRRNSCSTFSTTLGLASMLNERGIKAVTPSCLNTPSGANSFTPTATPANSPDGSPTHSRSSSPEPGLSGFLSSSAEMIRRTFIGNDKPMRRPKRVKALTHSERKALSGIRILEEVEKIGVGNIMATAASGLSPVALQGAIYSRRNLTSPMAQLTSLKGTISSSISSERLNDQTQSTPDATHTKTNNKPPLPPPAEKSCPGVPAQPGSGALERRLKQLQGRQRHRHGADGATRPDLGTVSSHSTPLKQSQPQQQQRQQQPQQQTQSAFGTLSSLLFGRKGGLL